MDMNNIANLFRPVQQTSQVAAPAAAPAAGTGAAPAKTGMEQVNSGAGAGSQDNLEGAGLGDGKGTKQDSSPMDAFNDLFKVDPNKPAPKDPMAEPLLTMDHGKILEAVNKMDFTRGIDPALVQKALAGDVASFTQVLNSANRAAYMSSFQAITGILERAVKTNNERFNSVLGDKFRNFSISSATTDNPVLRHASVQPVLAAIRDTIAKAKPNLSASEVSKEAEQYFLTMGDALSSLTKENELNAAGGDKTKGAEPDWFKTFNVSPT